MFTIDQIKAAHANVKSGADFPRYVKDLIALGVVGYVTFVTDGHTEFLGKKNHSAISPAKYDPLAIADVANVDAFVNDLKDHQGGKSDYPTFCASCASNGVYKWVVVMDAKTCTYFDRSDNVLLVETIPV